MAQFYLCHKQRGLRSKYQQLLFAGGIIGSVMSAAGGLSLVMLGLTLIVVCAVTVGVLWFVGKALGFFDHTQNGA